MISDLKKPLISIIYTTICERHKSLYRASRSTHIVAVKLIRNIFAHMSHPGWMWSARTMLILITMGYNTCRITKVCRELLDV